MKGGYFVIDGDGHVHEGVDGGAAPRGHKDRRFQTQPLREDNYADRSVAGK